MRVLLSLSLCLFCCACGMRPPEIEEFYEREPWREVKVNDNLGLNIKKRVFCELVSAIRSTYGMTVENDGRVIPALPSSYGVQMQLTLAVEETGALNPSIGITDPNPAELFSGISVPQSVGLNLTGTVSSAATRTDISYAYYNIAKISGRDEQGNFVPDRKTGKLPNAWCDSLDVRGSSLIIRSELGLSKWLRQSLAATTILHSTPVGYAKDAKLDVFSYEVKFVVVTSMGINPVIRIAKIGTGIGNQPLVGLGRTRTHTLTLTVGPGAGAPIAAAVAAHFSAQGAPVTVVPVPAN